MNPEIKARWVAALRSGEYKQGRNVLHRMNLDGTQTFCCLGVLCDLAAKEGAVDRRTPLDPEGGLVYYDHVADFLPTVVRGWAGISDSHPYVEKAGELARLASINDDGLPFNEIADLIEAQL